MEGTMCLSLKQVEGYANAFKELADYFMTIRMDWSDPRSECRAGMDLAKNAIKSLTGEDYEPQNLMEG